MMSANWKGVLFLIGLLLQIYLTSAQFECHTCYRSVVRTATRLTSSTTSYRTNCWAFFRCTNYRRQYRIETYTTYSSVAYCCRTTGQVNPLNGVLRLSGGSRENTGRLEVYYGGRWGTVCDDQFNNYDSEVSCFQMGFAGDVSYRTLSGGTGPIWLDSLGCRGTETWLTSCTHNGWGIHDCTHSEDVGLTCSSRLQVRLVGGSNAFQGRIEYYKNGVWGTVCDDYFDSNDAKVVCNQLGYGNSLRITKFGRGTGSIFFDDLDCTGNELSLMHCPRADSHNCGHTEDEGVVCAGPTPTISRKSTNSPSSVYLAWTTPWQLKFLGVVTGYVVQYGTTTIVSRLRTKTISTTQVSYSTTITGLTGGTTYYFRVAISVRGAQGPYSSFTSMKTVTPNPLAVTSLRAYATSPTTIRVTWSYPGSTSRLSGFLVSYDAAESSGIALDGQARVSRYSTSYSFSLLEEDVPYRISVQSYVGSRYSSSSGTTVRTFTALPSAAPQNVRISSRSSTSLSIVWSPPDLRHRNGPITGYTVQVYLQSGGNAIVTSATRTYISVSGLTPYKSYRVKVAAKNSNGTGPYSIPIVGSTTAAVPSAPPQSVVLIVTSTSSIHLQWRPPTSSSINGILTGYVIRYALQGQATREINLGSSSTRRDFTGLSTYSRYSFAVAAKNSIGRGPFSNTVYATTLSDVPNGAPTSLSAVPVSSTALVVAWVAPPQRQRNGRITSYSVKYGKNRFLSDGILTTSIGTSTRIVGLSPYTTYYVQVAASTVNGTGVYSGAVSARTYQGVPSAPPQDVSANVSTVSPLIVVSWTPPPKDGRNGPLSDMYYIIQYSIIGNSVSTVIVRSGALRYTLINLSYCKEYLVRVAAANTNGTGPYSSNIIKSTTGLSHCTNPPLNVTVVATGSQSLRVAWQPPQDDGSNHEITSYKVVYGELSEARPRATSRSASLSLAVDITGLIPFTVYYVRVAAVRGSAVGVYSNTSYVKTLSEVPPKFDADSITVTTGSVSMSIAWEEPKNAYGVIIGYVIKVRDEPNKKRAVNSFEVGGRLSNFTVGGLTPSTRYCVQMAAVNGKGQGEASDDVCQNTKEDVPGKVGNVTVTSITSQSLTVQWSAPESPNGVIRRYLLDYNSGNREIPHNGQLRVPYHSTLATISDLHEGVQYEVSVRAVTRKGPGVSVSVSATTYTAAPSGAPERVNLTAQSSTTILVTWLPPVLTEQNGPILRYKVLYREADGNNVTKSVSDLSVVLRGLKPYTTSFVQVAAVNSNGTGPYSDIEETTTFSDHPSPPNMLTLRSPSSRSIVVLWDPPVSPNGILTGYSLSYRAIFPTDLPDSHTGITRITGIDFSDTSYRIRNLLTGVQYEVNVTATNDAGTSAPAVADTTTVSTKPQSAPIDFNVTSVSSNTITLSWKPPPVLQRKGKLEKYRLSYYIVDSFEITTKLIPVTDETTVTSYTVEELEPFTFYGFKVEVENDAESSEPTDEIQAQTLEGRPSNVCNLTATDLGKTYVTISWSPPEQPNGDIINYQIMLDDRVIPPLPETVFTYNITKLKPNTRYEIVVIAGNSAENSTGEKLNIVTDGLKGQPLVGKSPIATPALYGLIGGMIVLAVIIVMCIVLVVCLCVWRYRKVKAMAVGRDLDLPDSVSVKSGIYEEITDGFRATVSAIGKDIEREEEENKKKHQMENPYVFSTPAPESPYDIPKSNVRCVSPNGSITEDLDVDMVKVSSEGVYYNVQNGHVDSEIYDDSVVIKHDPSNEYDVPRSPAMLKSTQKATNDTVAPKVGVAGYDTLKPIRLESASTT